VCSVYGVGLEEKSSFGESGGGSGGWRGKEGEVGCRKRGVRDREWEE